MKTLIIYDKVGAIIKQVQGNYTTPIGVPFIEVEVPKGKYVVSVDIETNQPIYEDIPPTEIELLHNKICTLNGIVETQEENLAMISYEVMMSQTGGDGITLVEGQHSPKFNMIRIWYNKGFWTADMVQNAVEHKWLTQEEANEIMGA